MGPQQSSQNTPGEAQIPKCAKPPGNMANIRISFPAFKNPSSFTRPHMVNNSDGKVLKLETYKGGQEIKTSSVSWFVMTYCSWF